MGPIGLRLPAKPRPYGDPAGTLRVGAAGIVEPLYLFPGTAALRAYLARVYNVPVIAATEPPFRDWIGHLLAEAA